MTDLHEFKLHLAGREASYLGLESMVVVVKAPHLQAAAIALEKLRKRLRIPSWDALDR